MTTKSDRCPEAAAGQNKRTVSCPQDRLRTGELSLSTTTVPDTASYIRGWIQMVLAPNDLFSWNNKYSKYTIIYIANAFTSIFQLSTSTHSAHAGILKPWRGRLPCLLAVFSSHHVSRLIPFPVRAQLTLFVPAFGTGSPFPQNGAPIHRVCAHSLTRVHDNYYYYYRGRPADHYYHYYCGRPAYYYYYRCRDNLRLQNQKSWKVSFQESIIL